jgi:multidrug efflux pump subunit AcrA (membrane-fusion protein)
MTFLRKNYNILNRYRRFSSIRRVRKRKSYKRFYVFCWGLIGGGVIALMMMPWTQTISGQGKVIAYSPDERRQEISAPIEGIVDKWRVSEGQRVKKGEIIVDLVDNDPDLINRLKLERDATAKNLEVSKMAVETALSNVKRQERLVKKGLAAPLELERARLNYNKYLAAEAKATVDLARVEVKLSRQRSQNVMAPINGTILKIIAGQGGQLVKQGAKLAVLVPDTASRAVELYVKGNDMPLLSTGRIARLQFEGWPAVQFSGWPSVAVGTFAGKVGFIDAADDGRGYFRVLIFPTTYENWPDSRFLRQGVRVKGWILLEEVSVGFELWRIFNGFPPALRESESNLYDLSSYADESGKKVELK